MNVARKVSRAREQTALTCIALVSSIVGCGGPPAAPIVAAEVVSEASGGEALPEDPPPRQTCGDCVERGWALSDAGDPAGARPLFEQACEEGSVDGCAAAGQLYGRGQGVTRDLARSVRYYERACDGGHVLACFVLANERFNGTNLTQDRPHAVSLYGRACEGGHAPACTELGAILLNGEGVPVDLERARTASEEGCRLQSDGACTNLALALVRGSAERQDPARARALLDASCERRHAGACSVLGIVVRDAIGGPADPARAVALFERACASEDANACLNLGAAYHQGRGVARDAERARALFRRACDSGQRAACANLERETQPTAAGPPFRTTIGTITVDGATFADVRATCGMMEVMAILSALRPGLARCSRPPRISMTIADGRAADVSSSGNGGGARCAIQAARAARFGTLSCTVELERR